MRSLLSVPLLVAVCALAACGSPRSAAHAERSGCDGCHGSGGLGMPPPSFSGATSTSERGVGAHVAHLSSDLANPALSCADCHIVPRNVGDPGHMSPASLVSFGARARAGGATPSWDATTGTCSGTACHAQPGATAPAPRWTDAGLLPGARCAHCHGGPPPRPHPPWSACDRCHGGGTPTAPGVVPGPGHLDGAVDAVRFHPASWVRRTLHGAAALAGTDSCLPCHGPKLMDVESPLSCAACHVNGGISCGSCHGAPPASGAHARHHDGGGAPGYGKVTVLAEDGAPGAGYRFGCGQCHPVDDAHHLDGTVDVDLSPAGAPPGSLKARNGAGAAYVKAPGEATGRCSEIACHSSGQQGPAFVTTPRWDETGLGCDGCHANPPRYASGGPGSATANSHTWIETDATLGKIAGGHWGDLPSWGHRDLGHPADPAVQGASPITCQACHYDSVDPAHTGPAGFYYLDTTSRYDLAPGLGGWTGCNAAGCHTGGAGAPPVQGGKANPLRHVNGTRDVVFDPRTSVAGYGRLPAAPNTPTFPYWRFPGGVSTTHPDVRADNDTVSMHLANARWDAATKTCSNVACHLAQTSVTWGGTPELTSACTSCHTF